MSAKTRVLIVEDDRDLSRLLQIEMQWNGYEVLTAANGVEGVKMAQEYQPDLVVLDIMLPLMDGRAVCQRIRDFSNVPIVMMTARSVTEEDIAYALNLGADEFMVKPLKRVEFLARVKALLRRARPPMEDPSAGVQVSSYRDSYLSVDLAARQVFVNGEEVRLTPTEFKLLAMFIRNSGNVLTFQQLLEHVWGAEYIREHHYPRIYVSHLRRKIEPDAKAPLYIQNEYGVGYRFVAQTAAR